ncbi:MAG: hypothetical protein AAGH92_02830 [Planctomycetota bacterium]
MPTDTQANPNQANPTQAKASNFLANLNRFTARPEPAPATGTAARSQANVETKPQPEASTGIAPQKPEAKLPATPQAPPVPVDAPTKPKATPRLTPEPAAKPIVKRRKPRAEPKTTPPQDTTPQPAVGTQLHRSFTVAPGTGTKVLTARVPRALHARLTLLATANKFADTDEHEQDFTTVNAIVMDALHDWLAKHDPQSSPADAA